jgi:hypothetical protein
VSRLILSCRIPLRHSLLRMSWSIASLWAAAVGLLLLTFGTAAQARANVLEYRDLFPSVAPAAIQALREKLSMPILLDILSGNASLDTKLFKIELEFLRALVSIPRKMREIRIAAAATAAVQSHANEEDKAVAIAAARRDADRITTLARMSVAWSVLMFGSMVVLAGATIQLALAYVRG